MPFETKLDTDSRNALHELSGAVTAGWPWLEAHASVAQRALRITGSPSVADALNAARDDTAVGPTFVSQAEMPAGEAYESFVFRTGQVPTRDNLHDLFNGLMWLKFPQTKRRLNVLQAEQLALNGVTTTRGALRDALTVFDENAAILQAPTPLVDALRRRDWNVLFNEQRSLWKSARVVLFGHALLEKLMRPRKAITAHVWVVDALTDESLAASLDPERLAAKDFLPLPILGVPGWWPADDQATFYDDPEVFRPSREGHPT